MTTRERWTVYPLLFLAIGLGVRAQSLAPDVAGVVRVDALDASRVVCRELRVDADDGTTLVHAGRVRGGGGGRIEIRDAKGRDSVAIGTNPGRREGGVEFFETDGRESARLTTTGLGDPPPADPSLEEATEPTDAADAAEAENAEAARDPSAESRPSPPAAAEPATR